MYIRESWRSYLLPHIFLSGMVVCVILRMKKGGGVCYRVYIVSHTVGAHEAFDIYSRARHLKPEKQMEPGGTVCPPRRFQRPSSGDFVASGTQALRITGESIGVDTTPVPVRQT